MIGKRVCIPMPGTFFFWLLFHNRNGLFYKVHLGTAGFYLFPDAELKMGSVLHYLLGTYLVYDAWVRGLVLRGHVRSHDDVRVEQICYPSLFSSSPFNSSPNRDGSV